MNETATQRNLFADHPFGPLRVVLRFDGRAASNGVLTTDSLLASLKGWDNLLFLFDTLVLRGAPVGPRTMHLRRPATRVHTPQRGSFEIVLLWAGLEAVKWGYNKALDKGMPTLWRLFCDFISSYPAMKYDADTLASLAEQLRKFLREASMNMIDDEVNLYHSAVALEDVIYDATMPLDESATTLRLSTNIDTRILEIDQDFRIKSAEPLQQERDTPLDAEREVLVRFVRLNVKTGRGLIEVYTEGAFLPSQYCLIDDPSLRLPRNPYSESLSSQDPLKVIAQKMQPKEGRYNVYWRIAGYVGEAHQKLLFAGSK